MSNEIQPYGRRAEDYYDWFVTLRKGVVLFAVILTAIIAVDFPQTIEEFESGWKAYLFAVAMAIVKTAWNWYKNADKPSLSQRPGRLPCHWIALALAMSLVFAGCVTRNYSKVSTDPKTGIVSQTNYKSTSAAWPFGKIDAAAEMFSDYDSSTKTTTHKEVAIAQDAKNIDNTGMTEALKAVMPLFEVLLRAAIAAQTPAPTP